VFRVRMGYRVGMTWRVHLNDHIDSTLCHQTLIQYFHVG
jgi:hypothetical protein